MITTYKKLAALAVSLGESSASAKYLEKAEELMANSPETQKIENMNDIKTVQNAHQNLIRALVSLT